MRKKIVLFITLIFTLNLSIAQTLEVLQGDISSNKRLTADKQYLLRGFVRVQSGATLTIDPGVVIYGENTTKGTLIIKPGGKIMAKGTADKPIVFTSEFAKSGSTKAPTYGDWGGIILLGKAPINVPGGKAQIEGTGDASDEYGGNDPDDNSGVMQYVRIEYPGIAYSLNNEINGLTFGGVGRGTTIDHIQVSYSGDDAFEWFGGTVNCKYLISYRAWDDDFDTDFGYSGKLQYLVSIRDPEIADQSKSNGFESDNDGSGSTNTPITSPTWWNVTLIGPKATENTTINSLYNRAMHLRRSSQNKINNALILGWPNGVILDGQNTVQAAKDGNCYIKNSIIAGASKPLDTTASKGVAFDISSWFTNNGSKILSTNSDVKLVDPFNLSRPNYLPMPNSPVFTGAGTPPNDGFFDKNATFIGAFGTEDWTRGWANYNPGSYNSNFIGAFGSVDWTAGWANFNPINYKLTAVKKTNKIPESFQLEQNYPNPFNPSTMISFSIPKDDHIKLVIYNTLGQVVETLIDGNYSSGYYNVKWDASRYSSGIYFYTLETSERIMTKKMMLIK